MKVEIPCDYSKGWLVKFKNRHGIRYVKASGDKISAGKVAADEFIEKFKKIVDEENILPELIYNMDETRLFWCNLPRKTFVSEEEKAPSAIKDDRRRITVLLCNNAEGTHKCRVLVVGKSATPRPLSALKKSSLLPVIYQHNSNAWITRELCTRAGRCSKFYIAMHRQSNIAI